MNLSGESVKSLCHFFKINISDILVIHDDLELPFGTVALKSGGGLSGHNGLKSIAEEFADKNFMRLRVGIGRPEKGSVSNWVLSSFSKEEEMFLEELLVEGSKIIDLFIEKGFDKISNEFKKKKILKHG